MQLNVNMVSQKLDIVLGFVNLNIRPLVFVIFSGQEG